MTPYEVDLAKVLNSCSLLPGSSQKRFIRDIAWRAQHSPDEPITLRQRHYMEILAWRFRRQLPAKYVPDRKPFNLPRPVKESKKRTRRKKAEIAETKTEQGRLL